jgi:hypothetical protein
MQRCFHFLFEFSIVRKLKEVTNIFAMFDFSVCIMAYSEYNKPGGDQISKLYRQF